MRAGAQILTIRVVLAACFLSPAFAFATPQTPPRVVVLSTGGTIASQYEPELGGLVPALTGEQSIAAVPVLGDVSGRLIPLYAGKGRRVALRDVGCILADHLSPQKARILLMLGLTRTREPAELQALFDR
jgi:L-asparaginase/Glu-tRNA(Gln) amidotransferase subunit D